MNDPTCPTVCYNRQWVFSQAIGAGGVVPGQTFRIREETFDSLGLQPGEAIIKTEFVFLEPFWEPSELGAVQPAAVVATVVAVNDPEGRFRAHDIVEAFTGWQLYAKVSVGALRKIGISTLFSGAAEFEHAVLAIAGRAAYFGFLEHGKPKKGDTLVINGAYGAAAELLVRLARRLGLRVIVIGRSEAELLWVDSLLPDAVLDGRDAAKLNQGLKKAAPNGIDILVDNVGGPAAESAFELLATGARVVVLGHLPQLAPARRVLHNILFRRATVAGVHPLDYRGREDELLDGLRPWMDEGRIKIRPAVKDGLENLPEALQSVFSGSHFGGHLLVRADYEPEVAPLSPALPAPSSPRRLQVTLH
eukprot:TRINITY_DN2567_c0_g1_i3.p1 TRINITY_DN2567_c0_g1~~TRINITY_DN2567_c0_g1_i3.p1  ORF type:complete len:370 (+),score=61.55 TRINITY_DN2567_c0_g1_i3:25-1110(+)